MTPFLVALPNRLFVSRDHRAGSISRGRRWHLRSLQLARSIAALPDEHGFVHIREFWIIARPSRSLLEPAPVTCWALSVAPTCLAVSTLPRRQCAYCTCPCLAVARGNRSPLPRPMVVSSLCSPLATLAVQGRRVRVERSCGVGLVVCPWRTGCAPGR